MVDDEWEGPSPVAGDQATARPPTDDDEAAPPKVLIVDDEPILRSTLTRILDKAGFATTAADSGEDAIRFITTTSFAVILADINMPGMSGIELLRVVRGYDLDVSVVLMTGAPETRTAIEAVELGALHYLCKPFEPVQLVSTVKRGTDLYRLARLKREAMRLLGKHEEGAGDLAGLAAGLDRALETLHIAIQPIVSIETGMVVANEVLLRCSEPTLPTPPDVIAAAERLGRLQDVGRAVRSLAARALKHVPGETDIFVNLHPMDLVDPELADGSSPLGQIAERVVLEITERESLDVVPDVGARISILRYMGYRFAIDDLGAGHAGLGGFSRCEPDFVKLDMSLVRGIHLSSSRRRLVRALFGLCKELRTQVIAEGIEALEERNALRLMGCDWMQGYFFGRPMVVHPGRA